MIALMAMLSEESKTVTLHDSRKKMATGQPCSRLVSCIFSC